MICVVILNFISIGFGLVSAILWLLSAFIKYEQPQIVIPNQEGITNINPVGYPLDVYVNGIPLAHVDKIYSFIQKSSRFNSGAALATCLAVVFSAISIIVSMYQTVPQTAP